MIQTQLARARRGEATPEMEAVARAEGVDFQTLMERVAQGKVVIPANKGHRGLRPTGIGEGLTVKVNANIGTSSEHADPAEELQKLEAALDRGAVGLHRRDARGEAHPRALTPPCGNGSHLPGRHRGGPAQGGDRPDERRRHL